MIKNTTNSLVWLAVLFISISNLKAQDSILVSGTVKDAGTSAVLPGAKVYLVYMLGNWKIGTYEVLTGEGGSYSITIPKIVNANAGMVVAADSYKETRDNFGVKDGTGDVENNFLLNLIPGIFGDTVIVSGKVTSGFPEVLIAGAQITITAGTGTDAVTAAGISKSDGTYEISLYNSPKATLLSAIITAEGYENYVSGPFDNLSISDPADGEPDLLKYFNPKLDLVPEIVTWTIAGVLHDMELNVPIEGGQVSVVADGFKTSVLTDASGTFTASIEVDELSARGVTLEVYASGYDRIYSTWISKDSIGGTNFDYGTIEMTPKGWIVSASFVNSVTREPVQGTQIQFISGDYSKSISTDEYGKTNTAVMVPTDSSGVTLIVIASGFKVYENWIPYDESVDGNFSFGTIALEPSGTGVLGGDGLQFKYLPGAESYTINGKLVERSVSFTGMVIHK